MKLDNPIPKEIYITTDEPISINGTILQITDKEKPIKIEEMETINEKTVFLTHDIAKSFVQCNLAIFDYQKEENEKAKNVVNAESTENAENVVNAESAENVENDKSDTASRKTKKAKTESAVQDENTNQA